MLLAWGTVGLYRKKMNKAWFTLQHKHKQIKTKENMSGGAFEDKKMVFFFVFSFVLTLLMLGLMSVSWAYVDTLGFIPLCSPLFSANP